jgi:rhamnogalacturonyl hydrolase YesR
MNRRLFSAGIAAVCITHHPSLRALSLPLLEESKPDKSEHKWVDRLIEDILDTGFEKINTDWDGSIRIESLLRFARRGNVRAGKFAVDWLAYHIEHDSKLSDEQYYNQYDGPHTRIVREDPLTFSLYSANLGVAFPAYAIYRQFGNQQARKVAIEVANTILEIASRDRFGMLSDDNDHYHSRSYAIPDTTYWATRSCAIAAELTSGGAAELYLQQAVFQLQQGVRSFFDPQRGLVHTGLFDGVPGSTYWCRSQGWLLWAISGLLRHLPQDHPQFSFFVATMDRIIDGVTRNQTSNGALHVLVDDPSTPEEVTGIAMVIACASEAMQRGWVSPRHQDMCRKGWDFINASVSEDGRVSNAYTGWAATAEEHQMSLMDQKFRGFVPGIILAAADEMLAKQ